jgi:hypothetical protein
MDRKTAMKIRRSHLFLLSLLLISSLPFGRAAQKPQWKGSISKEGDVVVVKNPKEPIHKGNILAFKEELSIGGAEAKPEQSFSEIGQILLDEEENIYVLDPKDANIKIFDKAVKYLRTIGRKGQGPGEFVSPSSLDIDSKWYLNILDRSLKKFQILTPEGKEFKAILSVKNAGEPAPQERNVL